MINHIHLHVEIEQLEPMPVVFLKCTLGDHHWDHDKRIRETFEFIRQWAGCMRLNPEDLVQVGLPTLKDGQLTEYTCCLEYPLGYIDEHAEVNLGELPGGTYAVTRVDETSHGIGLDIRQMVEAYLQEQQLAQDPHRPIREIYHRHFTEYCIPLKS
jgi:DNA gyrase inhibitor GyrI